MPNQDPIQEHASRDAILAKWVDEHADAMFRFALSRVSDEHVIEDLLQETFLAALRGWASFEEKAQPRTWLIAILRLKIIDYYRHQARLRSAKEEQALRLEKQLFRERGLAAWNCDASNTIENGEFWATFQSCVEKLPSSLARAFLLRELDGCSSAMICKILNISGENLAVRIFRARAALRDCLDKNWFSEDGQ